MFFTTSERSWFIYNAYRGVALASDHIAWSFSNKDDSAWYNSIVEVRLQTGGNWIGPIGICEITFADRYRLLVTNSNALGNPVAAQRAAYRDFLYDLHTRLVAHAATRERPPIAFNAGIAQGRFGFVTTGAIVLGLILVAIPLAALLFTGEVKPLLLLCAGLFFVWPLVATVAKNAPRSYDPKQLPRELVG